jgi:hypothetical protein
VISCRGILEKKESKTQETESVIKSICDDCNAYPEGIEVKYDVGCPRGYLTLKNKAKCISYKPKSASKEKIEGTK